jgi:hypothetical protein
MAAVVTSDTTIACEQSIGDIEWVQENLRVARTNKIRATISKFERHNRS